MSKPIGGYFELELNRNNGAYHSDSIALNTGRNSFEYILLCKKINHIHIPYLTCDVILEPIKKHKIAYTFYHINNQFEPLVKNLLPTDYVLYNNYFGLNQSNIINLIGYHKNVIIDNAQAFYDYAINQTPTFYSPRKFFGIPDGGFVSNCDEINICNFHIDKSEERLSHLFARIEKSAKDGYASFKLNEEKLSGQDIKRMSKITNAILNSIDYPFVKKKRVQNFNFLHSAIGKLNKLNRFIDNNQFCCPMVYPFWVDNGKRLRQKLIDNNIYIAHYWPNVLKWVQQNDIEYEMVENIVHLPIDQRYNINQIKIIEQIILND